MITFVFVKYEGPKFYNFICIMKKKEIFGGFKTKKKEIFGGFKTVGRTTSLKNYHF